MNNPVELLSHALDNLGVAVPRVVHGNARGEVDVAAPLDVPEFGVFSPVDINV